MEKNFGSLVRTQRGMVLVLAAMLLTVFMFIVGLAIDISHLSVVKEEARGHARLAALAALDGYWQRPCANLDVCNLEAESRLKEAKDRVNGVSSPNRLLAQNKQADAKSFVIDGEVLTPKETRMVPGRWLTAAHAGLSCPNNQYPCFVTLQDQNRQLATAMRMESKYITDYRLPLLGHLLPAAAEVNVQVTASLVPRRGCFLVDLSKSTVANTHGVIPGQVLDAGARPLRYEYAYHAKVIEYASQVGIDELTIPAKYREAVRSWRLMPDTRPPGDSDKTRHYRSDYRRYSVVDDTRCTTGTEPGCSTHPAPTLLSPHVSSTSRYKVTAGDDDYFVDVYRSDSYAGPEPLRYFLSAISQSIEFLKDRGVPGDMACVVFFDDRLEWPRILKLSGSFDEIKQAIDSSSLVDLLTAGDQDLKSKTISPSLLRTIQYHLFPKQGRNTDLYLALQEALYQFTAASNSGVQAADFVVLMSDFIPNCVHTDPGNAFMRLDHYWEQLYYMPYVNTCENSYRNYRRAMEDTKALARRVFYPAGIPIHVLVAGDSLDLHSLDVENAQVGRGVCHTDESIRMAADRRLQYVDLPKPYAYPYYPDGRAVSPKPYLGDIDLAGQKAMDEMAQGISKFSPPVADSHDIAQMTGGVWLPLRSPGGNCEPKDYRATRMGCTSTPVRRAEDPWCRSAYQQIQDFMVDVMGEHPSVIVEAVTR